AASVGVAMPPRIEPRTAAMSRIGATKTAINRRASARPFGAAGSGGVGGGGCGEKTAMEKREERDNATSGKPRTMGHAHRALAGTDNGAKLPAESCAA